MILGVFCVLCFFVWGVVVGGIFVWIGGDCIGCGIVWYIWNIYVVYFICIGVFVWVLLILMMCCMIICVVLVVCLVV